MLSPSAVMVSTVCAAEVLLIIVLVSTNSKLLVDVVGLVPICQAAMSRFFKQQGDSDSDTEESEEELLSSGDDEAPASTAKPATAPARGMSRFLRTAGSDDSSSESESDDDEESDTDVEAAPQKKKISRFRRDQEEESEDDEEDVKRIVKSAKDKRLEEMETTGRAIDNALKINDWIAISNGVFVYEAHADSDS